MRHSRARVRGGRAVRLCVPAGMGSTFDFWVFGAFLVLCYKLHPGTDVLNSPDAQRKPCMDSLCLLVDLCQTHCVPSVNLSHECFLSAAYTRLKGNGRQAWPLTRANPVNQHSATLAASPHQIKTDGCKGNWV